MTPKLKSDPTVPEPSEQREWYLTTVGSGHLNPEEVLAVSGSKPVVLVVVEVVPRASRTGLFEERGDWVHALWSAVMGAMPFLQGCRMDWSSVFFVAETTDLEAVQEQFRRVLLVLRQPDLQSRCILSLAEGATDQKARLLYGEMSHDVTASGVGFRSRFAHGLIDGSDWVD